MFFTPIFCFFGNPSLLGGGVSITIKETKKIQLIFLNIIGKIQFYLTFTCDKNIFNRLTRKQFFLTNHNKYFSYIL